LVTRFGGHVAQLLGDGLVVLFGYPRAHEDSAEQAVRAALGDDGDVVMHVVWDPPWTPERLTPMAMERLGFAPR
jgi:class 3 adenylate cyclase